MTIRTLMMTGLSMLATTVTFADKGDAKFEIPQNAIPGKICLLVTDVGTIDTVAKTEEFLTQIKQFNTEEAPKLSAAGSATDASLAQQVTVIKFNDEMRKYSDAEREVAARNRRMEAVLTQVRNAIIGNENMRNVVVAKNYLQSFLQPYADHIQVIDRANTNLAEVEKAIGGNDQQDVASACMFLTVILQDVKEESQTVQVGNTMVKKTKHTQKAVYNVRDFNGNVVTAGNVVADASKRTTSASKVSGYNPSDDLMEGVLKQIADQMAAHFLCTVEVECVGPKGDDDFDEDDVTLTMDGNDFSSGDTVLVGIKHTFVGECEGYKTVKKNETIKKGGQKTIKMKFKKEKKATEEVETSAVAE